MQSDAAKQPVRLYKIGGFLVPLPNNHGQQNVSSSSSHISTTQQNTVRNATTSYAHDAPPSTARSTSTTGTQYQDQPRYQDSRQDQQNVRRNNRILGGKKYKNIDELDEENYGPHSDEYETYDPEAERRRILGSDAIRRENTERYERIDRYKRSQQQSTTTSKTTPRNNTDGSPFAIRGTTKRVIEVTTTEVDELNQFMVQRDEPVHVRPPLNLAHLATVGRDHDDQLKSGAGVVRVRSSRDLAKGRSGPLVHVHSDPEDELEEHRLYARGERTKRVKSAERESKEEESVAKVESDKDEREDKRKLKEEVSKTKGRNETKEKVKEVQREDKKSSEVQKREEEKKVKEEQQAAKVKEEQQQAAKEAAILEEKLLKELEAREKERERERAIEKEKERERERERAIEKEKEKAREQERAIEREKEKERERERAIEKEKEKQRERERALEREREKEREREREREKEREKEKERLAKKLRENRNYRKSEFQNASNPNLEANDEKRTEELPSTKKKQPKDGVTKDDEVPRSRKRRDDDERGDPRDKKDKEKPAQIFTLNSNRKQEPPPYELVREREKPVKLPEKVVKDREKPTYESTSIKPIRAREYEDLHDLNKKPAVPKSTVDFQSDSFKLPQIPNDQASFKKRQADSIAKFLAVRVDNLPSRRYYDPGWKRCPCLMHMRRYANYGRPPADEEQDHPRHNHWKDHHVDPELLRALNRSADNEYNNEYHEHDMNHPYHRKKADFLKKSPDLNENNQSRSDYVDGTETKNNPEYNEMTERIKKITKREPAVYYKPKKQFETVDRPDWDTYF